MQHRREAEVGVAGGVGAAQLGPGRPLLAGVVERHPDQRRAVAARPGEVGRRLVAGDQPLVGVDPLREQRRDLARVLELAGDERLRRSARGSTGRRRRRRRCSPSFASDWWTCMPEPFSPFSGFGMKVACQPYFMRVLLDRDPVGHAVVGHRQRVLVAHVDLVLGGADLVVGVLDVDAHLLEREHGVAADVGAGVERRQVEVAALVEDLGDAALGLGVAEVEELELGADVEGRRSPSRVRARAPGAGSSAGRPRRARRRGPGCRRTSGRSASPRDARAGS